MKALGRELCGRRVIMGADALPTELEQAIVLLRNKWDIVMDTLNMQRCTAASENPTAASVAELLNCTSQSLNGLRKEDLLTLLTNVGHRQSSSLRKQQLISKLLQLQKDVSDGTVEIQPEQPQNMSEESQRLEDKSKLTTRLYSASLGAWVMKPLVSTAGMKEGSFNEHQVLKALPTFFEKNATANEEQPSATRTTISSIPSCYRVEYIRTVGLIGSRSVELLSGSPDGVAAITNQNGDVCVSAIEIKTMTSLQTIENANRMRSNHGAFVHVRQIGRLDTSLKLFHDLVPHTSYRLQCLHHCAVLGRQNVLFVVAKGSRMGVGQIIYCALLEVTESLIASYSYSLSSVRVGFFEWIGLNAKCIPAGYDDLLTNTHATDLFSFASFYSLSKVYKQLSLTQGPLPPARMIRPSGLVYWNHLKGGVDEFSRALKSLCYHNSSENPIVSVIGRLLCAQISNTAIVHRLSAAKARGLLPDKKEYFNGERKGYGILRHNVARCGSFSGFARHLAKEDKQRKDQSEAVNGYTAHVDVCTEANSFRPMFMKDAVAKYNRPADKERRLTSYSAHGKIKAEGAYCSLCSFSYTLRVHGRIFKKKGGARMKQWCSVCRQPICSQCWEYWHRDDTLSRAAISPEQLEALRKKAAASVETQ